MIVQPTIAHVRCPTISTRHPRQPDDLDIYPSAKLLIDHHGQDALIEAALKADELLDAGDFDGQAVWLRIRKAVLELLKPAMSLSLLKFAGQASLFDEAMLPS